MKLGWKKEMIILAFAISQILVYVIQFQLIKFFIREHFLIPRLFDSIPI